MVFIIVVSKEAKLFHIWRIYFMEENILEYSLEKLLELSMVSGVNDFSVKFLRKSESYARTIRSRGRDLPLGSQIILATRIHNSSQSLLKSGVGTQLGEELNMLAEKINQHIYKKALYQN